MDDLEPRKSSEVDAALPWRTRESMMRLRSRTTEIKAMDDARVEIMHNLHSKSIAGAENLAGQTIGALSRLERRIENETERNTDGEFDARKVKQMFMGQAIMFGQRYVEDVLDDDK